MEGKVDTIQDEIYKKGTLVNDKTELVRFRPDLMVSLMARHPCFTMLLHLRTWDVL